MIVRNHKRLNIQKDSVLCRIKQLCPDAHIRRTQLSVIVRLDKKWNDKVLYGDLPKMELPKVNYKDTCFMAYFATLYRVKTHILILPIFG